eukprot:2189760-Rhodomonas_salina.4
MREAGKTSSATCSTPLRLLSVIPRFKLTKIRPLPSPTFATFYRDGYRLNRFGEQLETGPVACGQWHLGCKMPFCY